MISKTVTTDNMINKIYRFYNAIYLFLRIVWREDGCVEVEKDKLVKLRMSWETAWHVAKCIWLK